MSRIYVIHENDTWVVPLRSAFEELSLPFEEWFLDTGRSICRKRRPKACSTTA